MIRGIDEELSGAKYAHIERERRFLVDPSKLPDLAASSSILIEDAYIDGTHMRLRRMTASNDGRVVLKLTKKYETTDPLARPIVTTYLDGTEFALLAGLPAHPVVKRRYACGAFSVDRFEGDLAGLWLAEIEMPDDAALIAATPPSWASREVSDDRGFDGGSLVRLNPNDLRARLAANPPAVQ